MSDQQQRSASSPPWSVSSVPASRLPVPVQKIPTVELDSKFIKLQIVSADLGGKGGGKERQLCHPVPACNGHSQAANSMHACSLQLPHFALIAQRTMHRTTHRAPLPQRVCLLFSAALRSGTQQLAMSASASSSAAAAAATTLAQTASL